MRRSSRFVLTPAARLDLADIHSFIAADDAEAAGRVLGELREAMRRLARTPGIGHARDDLADETLRLWPVYSYLVVYRPATRPLQVIRIVHGARDVQRLLLRR